MRTFDMGQSTNIEWADSTASTWTNCKEVSPGCLHCYARELAYRRGWVKPGEWGNADAYHRFVGFEKNAMALDRKAEASGKRLKVFPSLMDWLDTDVPVAWLADFMNVIHCTPNLDWLLLTKRPELFFVSIERIMLWQDGEISCDTEVFIDNWVLQGHAPANVWIGATVEDQPRTSRIPDLLKIPAAKRFLSVEPLLGPIRLPLNCPECGYTKMDNLIHGDHHICKRGAIPSIDWVIVGGESGPDARPCNVEWIRDVVRQCKAAGVPCFVKQLGSNPCADQSSVIPPADVNNPTLDPAAIAAWESYRHNARMHLKHSKGGNMEEWPEDLRVREMPV